jgi:hypothetical protein
MPAFEDKVKELKELMTASDAALLLVSKYYETALVNELGMRQNRVPTGAQE